MVSMVWLYESEIQSFGNLCAVRHVLAIPGSEDENRWRKAEKVIQARSTSHLSIAQDIIYQTVGLRDFVRYLS